jgi:hypothetical protein
MSTMALVLMALVLGWLTTLSLVRDLTRVELTDFTIAASGALAEALLLPRVGFEVWGEYGLRLSTLATMEAAALLTLIAANLARGRGIRAGALLSAVCPAHHAAVTVGHNAVKGTRIGIEHQGEELAIPFPQG